MKRTNNVNRRARRLNNVAHPICREAAALLADEVRSSDTTPSRVEIHVADTNHASYPATDVFQIQVRHCIERLLQTTGVQIVATPKDGHVHVVCILPY